MVEICATTTSTGRKSLSVLQARTNQTQGIAHASTVRVGSTRMVLGTRHARAAPQGSTDPILVPHLAVQVVLVESTSHILDSRVASHAARASIKATLDQVARVHLVITASINHILGTQVASRAAPASTRAPPDHQARVHHVSPANTSHILGTLAASRVAQANSSPTRGKQAAARARQENTFQAAADKAGTNADLALPASTRRRHRLVVDLARRESISPTPRLPHALHAPRVKSNLILRAHPHARRVLLVRLRQQARQRAPLVGRGSSARAPGKELAVTVKLANSSQMRMRAAASTALPGVISQMLAPLRHVLTVPMVLMQVEPGKYHVNRAGPWKRSHEPGKILVCNVHSVALRIRTVQIARLIAPQWLQPSLALASATVRPLEGSKAQARSQLPSTVLARMGS
eukprot:COSAG06_NODE_1382_length_9623_cov_4.820559_6_plen_404_part_00